MRSGDEYTKDDLIRVATQTPVSLEDLQARTSFFESVIMSYLTTNYDIPKEIEEILTHQIVLASMDYGRNLLELYRFGKIEDVKDVKDIMLENTIKLFHLQDK
jgi:hypothetical protein